MAPQCFYFSPRKIVPLPWYSRDLSQFLKLSVLVYRIREKYPVCADLFWSQIGYYQYPNHLDEGSVDTSKLQCTAMTRYRNSLWMLFFPLHLDAFGGSWHLQWYLKYCDQCYRALDRKIKETRNSKMWDASW